MPRGAAPWCSSKHPTFVKAIPRQQFCCFSQVPAGLSSWLVASCAFLAATYCGLLCTLCRSRVALPGRCAVSRQSSAAQQVGWAWWCALWLDFCACQAPVPAGWPVRQAPSGKHAVCVVVSGHLQMGIDAGRQEQWGPGRARALCRQWFLLASAQLDLWGRQAGGGAAWVFKVVFDGHASRLAHDLVVRALLQEARAIVVWNKMSWLRM